MSEERDKNRIAERDLPYLIADCFLQIIFCRLSAGTLQIVFMIFAGCLLFISISLLSLEFSFDFHVNKKRDRLADGLTDPHVEMRRRN